MLKCPKCKAPLSEDAINTTQLETCDACGLIFRVDAFPALTRRQAAVQADEIMQTDSEASCFYHPRKKAVVPCAVCGRFLCALCEVELDGRSMCLACVETGKSQSKIKSIENRRTLYDNRALSVAVLPMLFIYPTVITAPVALFMSIWYWKKPSSIIPRTKIRYVIAIILSLAQIVGWILLLWFLMNR